MVDYFLKDRSWDWVLGLFVLCFDFFCFVPLLNVAACLYILNFFVILCSNSLFLKKKSNDYYSLN
jgi:hypothetical protein